MLGSARWLGYLLLGTGVLAGSGLLGCTGTRQAPPNKTAAHLRTILQAYDLSLYRNRRPPRDTNDLVPFLQQLSDEDPNGLLRSPHDGQLFEILWGVNLD